MNNDQLAISIKSLNIIANFDMLILQFALISGKGLGRGRIWHRRTHPWGKIVKDISMARMFPKGMDALSPALLKFFLKYLKRIGRMVKKEREVSGYGSQDRH